MTTVGLELTTFIDPTLTWKTVSKGRNRRSRRVDSKKLKMNQGQEKKNAKSLNEAQSSESDKSDASIRGRGFSGNLEHIPIKKRRFLLRSPSPPPQPLNHSELESRQFNGGLGTFGQGNTEPPVTPDPSKTSVAGEAASNDINIERTVGCLNEASASVEDFSGIAILAAAACSDGLDNIGGDIGKSKKSGDNQSISSAPNMKQTGCEDICQMMDEGYVVDPPIDNSESACLTNNVKSVGDQPIDNSESFCLTNNVGSVGKGRESGVANAEPNEFALASDRKASVDCLGAYDSLKGDVPVVKETSPDLPSHCTEDVGKTLGSSIASRDYRLHWDLNTVMDEWDHPLDDPVDPGMQSSEVATAHFVNSQKTENEKASESPEKSVVIESGKSPGCTDFTGLFSEHMNPSSSKESSINGVIESNSEQDVYVEAGNSLSLGFHGKAPTLSTSESQFTGMVAQPQLHESDFSLVKPSGNDTCGVNNTDFELADHFKETHALEVCEHNVPAMNSQSVLTEFFGGDKCGISIDTSIKGAISSKITDIKCEKVESVHLTTPADAKEIKLAESMVQPVQSQPSITDISEVGLKVAVDSHCLSKTVVNYQAQDAMPTKLGDTSCVPDRSHNIPLGVDLSVPEAVLVEHPTVDPLQQLGCNTSDDLVDGVCGSHVSNKDSSQVTEDITNVPDTVGGYDSLLEDGELRESVGHCWDINEGEDGETERVDYDSDGREDVFFVDANDFVQLSGEVLAGEGGKQSCRSDNFSSADDMTNPEKGLEENCSLRHPGSSSAACAREAECTNHESPVPKACSSVQQHKTETISDRVEVDFKICRGSEAEAVSLGKECDSGVKRVARGTSLSGRGLEVPDRSMDCIKRSRSSNLDSIRPDEGSGESIMRHQSSLGTDHAGGKSCNGELRSAPEDGDGVIRVSGNTSPRVRRPCIIPTTRSGYHLIRRGSPVDSDNYGPETAKVRDFCPENNSRNRFDRFSYGTYREVRDRFRRPGMYDGGKSTGAMLNNYGKRERSFSPFDDRVDSCFPRSYRKSRSRSRTRSPDFRPEARMGRPRFGYPSAGHSADHLRDRRSPVRVLSQRQRFDTMGSAGRLRSDDCTRPMMRSVRFHDTSTSGRDHEYDEIDDYRRKPPFLRSRRSRSRSRSCSPDFRSDGRMGAKRPHYQPSGDFIRSRRSPVRGFRPGQRYDSGGSPERLQTDDGMRPMMRARFGNGGPGRGQDFNSGEAEYRGKPRNIFERIHLRNYEVDGDTRRLQYDEADNNAHNQNFRRTDNYTRGGDGRSTTDGFRRDDSFRRDDRGNARYNSDKMFSSAPNKQFGGMRDYGDNSLSRGVRP